jgi:hypothetical protein
LIDAAFATHPAIGVPADYLRTIFAPVAGLPNNRKTVSLFTTNLALLGMTSVRQFG